MGRRGFSLVELLVGLAIIAVVVGLLLSGVQRAREAAARARCQNNMRQLGLALHAAHGTWGNFPAGVTLPKGSAHYPFMSWHTRLLPFIEQQPIWDEAVVSFRTNRDFLSAPGHPGAERAVALFGCPLDARTAAPQRVADYYTRGLTSYLGVSGLNSGWADGVLFPDSATRLTDISDGTSCTLLLGERPPSADMVFGWWYAGWGQNRDGDADMILGTRAKRTFVSSAPSCAPGPYNFAPGALNNMCDTFHFWSLHPRGANFTFADGSVRFLRYSADDILPALATRSGGETTPMLD